MGGACCKPGGMLNSRRLTKEEASKGTLRVMFDRLDKEKKGYISEKNLHDLMKDDKTHFKGKDVSHIISKYGSEGKMSFEQFKAWWGSTYTTYGEDFNLGHVVAEVNHEHLHLDTITESAENAPESMQSLPLSLDPPHNSNVAVSRS